MGVPTAIIEARLESIPEMKYDATAEPPRGEICIRGPAVFKGCALALPPEAHGSSHSQLHVDQEALVAQHASHHVGSPQVRSEMGGGAAVPRCFCFPCLQ